MITCVISARQIRPMHAQNDDSRWMRHYAWDCWHTTANVVCTSPFVRNLVAWAQAMLEQPVTGGTHCVQKCCDARLCFEQEKDPENFGFIWRTVTEPHLDALGDALKQSTSSCSRFTPLCTVVKGKAEIRPTEQPILTAFRGSS